MGVVLAWIQKRGKLNSLSAGMQTGVATMEVSVEVPQTAKASATP